MCPGRQCPARARSVLLSPVTGKEEKHRSAQIYNHPNPCFGFYSASEKDLHCRLCSDKILGSLSSTTPRPQWGGATRAGTKHSPTRGWAERGFGFGTGFGGGVQPLHLGTGTMLQWGQLHYVQKDTPFPGEVSTEGPGCVLTPLPCCGGFVLWEKLPGKGQNPPEGFCKGQTGPGCPEAIVPWPCTA